MTDRQASVTSMLGMAIILLGLFGLPGWLQADPTVPDIPDVSVIDQDGRPHRFYSDLVKGRTVAISFIYTTCHTSCPATTALLRAAQRRMNHSPLEERATFLSITIDPVTDRPARLKALASKFDAGPGWYFLTGSTPDITTLVNAFEAQSGLKSDHPSLILVGNERTGRWTRHYGPASVPLITDLIQSVSGSSSPSPSILAP